jgi:predicted RNA binding protein YcfA (HicA-like mRNA interferase family)
MKSLSGRDFARIVERRGWTLLRVSGSHHIYGYLREKWKRRAAFNSNPRQQALKTGLLRHLAKLAEISDDDL